MRRGVVEAAPRLGSSGHHRTEAFGVFELPNPLRKIINLVRLRTNASPRREYHNRSPPVTLCGTAHRTAGGPCRHKNRTHRHPRISPGACDGDYGVGLKDTVVSRVLQRLCSAACSSIKVSTLCIAAVVLLEHAEQWKGGVLNVLSAMRRNTKKSSRMRGQAFGGSKREARGNARCLSPLQKKTQHAVYGYSE